MLYRHYDKYYGCDDYYDIDHKHIFIDYEDMETVAVHDGKSVHYTDILSKEIHMKNMEPLSFLEFWESL